MTAEVRHLRKMRKPKRYRTRPSKPLSIVGIEEAIQNLRNQASREGGPVDVGVGMEMSFEAAIKRWAKVEPSLFSKMTQKWQAVENARDDKALFGIPIRVNPDLKPNEWRLVRGDTAGIKVVNGMLVPTSDTAAKES